MLLFPKFIVIALIIGALCLTAIGLIALIALLLKDRKSKDIW